jgi:hypothetical protein
MKRLRLGGKSCRGLECGSVFVGANDFSSMKNHGR